LRFAACGDNRERAALMERILDHDDAEIWLFSYGTLQTLEVQHATFGRALEGGPDALVGHVLAKVPITHPDAIASVGADYHLNARETGHPADQVAGAVFRLTAAELAAADGYEAAFDYVRRAVRLKSGLEAFVYVWAGEPDQ
jgi:gamma-glutamylcyclotransferase (GGCT)/AIG2-like uncharacterized protein YtfP